MRRELGLEPERDQSTVEASVLGKLEHKQPVHWMRQELGLGKSEHKRPEHWMQQVHWKMTLAVRQQDWDSCKSNPELEPELAEESWLPLGHWTR